ncbi:amylo-alpha-1,6-glucosidase [Rhodohalobacter sp. 8-1]|uniref:amylo-alpha-1,6-glucosidase n=1 Tax=Rhodohalobacter sp. 8-1 TaxID=3131972 RepID=UPI0030ED3977
MKNPAPEITEKELNELIQSAKDVLQANWSGSFTRPSKNQYPHQWSWDSVFIAFGYTHYDKDRAEQELRHLFEGQWKNGMIPQIIFDQEHQSEKYFPGPDFWQSETSPNAPDHIKTSGICQPPIHATGVRHLIEYAPDRERAVAFASEIFPRLKAWHQYLDRERDPNNEGLVYIRHPWESGQDNSPIWDGILNRIEIEPSYIPAYSRKDINNVEPDERPSKPEYDTYVYLVNFFRERKYDEAKIRNDDCPFLVQDVLFNTLLCKANQDLAEIAEIIGENPEPFKTRADQIADKMNDKLWLDREQMYVDYDLKASKQIQARVLSGFLPIYASIPDQNRKQQIFEYLNTHCFCQMTDSCFPAPSYDRSGDDYSARTYWRGPVWINMNWLLYEGLKQYGFDDYVKQVRNSIIQLPFLSGFREYFDTNSGEGYGIENFSWTAALLLDILYREESTAIQ